MTVDLLRITDRGLFCEAGDFHIDPWAPVPRAVITHAHGDHLTYGCEHYLVSQEGRALALARLGGSGSVEGLPYGERRVLSGVTISFHPSGHILGSAQIRVEYCGEVWVVSGDYKLEPDPTCAPFELLRAHVFVTESTFGLPVYRWPDVQRVRDDMLHWIAGNREEGITSILMGYPLGKSQRLVAMLAGTDLTIWCHGATERMNGIYRDAGVPLPASLPVSTAPAGTKWSDGIVIGPPSVQGSPWLRRFGNQATAFASGWMLVRGARRRRNVERGFVVSDHADWPGLLSTVAATGAERVMVTHGFTHTLARYLSEKGYRTGVLPTRWKGDPEEAPDESAE